MKNTERSILLAFTGVALAVAAALYYYCQGRYTLATPAALWVWAAIPLLAAYELLLAKTKHAPLTLPTVQQFDLHNQWLTLLVNRLPFLLRMLAVALLGIALARPQSEKSWRDVTTEGIDIVISMDVSASMLAKDFDPNRLVVAKDVAIEFIKNRPNDRIGLVVYEGEAITQVPLTSDHRVLINLLKEAKSGQLEGGTAIGMGLATAVARLQESTARSKVVILLTDGDNNAGAVAPLTAAEMADLYGVRVYSIGVGSRGRALSPVAIYPDGSYKYEMAPVVVDDTLLTKVAQMTGGQYFRATNGQALTEIYQEIDRLEKTRINVTQHSQKSEEFLLFALAAAGLLMLEFIWRNALKPTTT